MTITYIGLSCFLIENKQGYRILVDPFNDSPEWILGPKFPKEF
jgi:L-ascorbate metabolism protein UlaG (beta-lactamase superfamily)